MFVPATRLRVDNEWCFWIIARRRTCVENASTKLVSFDRTVMPVLRHFERSSLVWAKDGDTPHFYFCLCAKIHKMKKKIFIA